MQMYPCMNACICFTCMCICVHTCKCIRSKIWIFLLGELGCMCSSEDEKATAEGRQQTALHRQTKKDLKPLFKKLKQREWVFSAFSFLLPICCFSVLLFLRICLQPSSAGTCACGWVCICACIFLCCFVQP